MEDLAEEMLNAIEYDAKIVSFYIITYPFIFFMSSCHKVFIFDVQCQSLVYQNTCILEKRFASCFSL